MPFENELRRVIREELERVFRCLGRGALSAEATTPGDELLSITAAAALGSYSPSTIKKWIRAGQLKSFGDGRCARVSRAELIRFLEVQAQKKARPVTDADIEDRAVAVLRGR